MERLADLSTISMDDFLLNDLAEQTEYIKNIYRGHAYVSPEVARDLELKGLKQKEGIYKTDDGDVVYWNGVTTVSGSVIRKKKTCYCIKRTLYYLTDAGHKAMKEYVIEQRLAGS